MVDIKSMSLSELEARFDEIGQPGFRAKQVFKWLHRCVESFDEMTDLPVKLREQLSREFFITVPQEANTQVSAQDGTIKYLWRLSDGNCVETVVMSYRHGNTVCISTQVGCRMGCAFCASTIGGKVRDLTAAEMLDEVIFSEKQSGKQLSNIVLMGIGEPLDNFDNVLRFLELINNKNGRNIGMRHISLSTSGIIDKIDKLAGYDLQLTLSVSLHAPDDETRSRLMPINASAGVDRLLKACAAYFEKTGRRISYEYAMIDGVNDSDGQAMLLGKKLAHMSGAHVNLILLNDVDGTGFKPSTKDRVEQFKDIVESCGVTVTVRRRLGSDIDASCGQLRRKVMDSQSLQTDRR